MNDSVSPTPPAETPKSLISSGTETNGNDTAAGNDTTAGGDTTSGSGTKETFVELTGADLVYPEGVLKDEAVEKELLAVVNGQKLSPKDRVNGLIGLYGKQLKSFQEAQTKAYADMQAQWADEVQKDPEVGGEKLTGVLSSIGKVVTQYGTPELRQIFDVTGVGNHIQMVKFLSKIAKDLNEGGHVPGDPAPQQRDVAKLIYDKTPT